MYSQMATNGHFPLLLALHSMGGWLFRSFSMVALGPLVGRWPFFDSFTNNLSLPKVFRICFHRLDIAFERVPSMTNLANWIHPKFKNSQR